MKQVEGIDLLEEVKAVEAALLEEKRLAIRTKIRHVIGGYHANLGTVKDLQQKLDKAIDKKNRLEGQLKAIKEGRWDVLEDKEVPVSIEE